MDVIINIDNSQSIFIPTVFEIMQCVKLSPDQYLPVGDKYFQAYFSKFEEITDFLAKDKEFFQLYGNYENLEQQIYSNLCTVYSLLEKMNAGKPIDQIFVHGMDSIQSGILIKQYLNKKMSLFLNFLPEEVLKNTFSKYNLTSKRIIQYGCEQAEMIYTISEKIKEYLVTHLIVSKDKIKLYKPAFYSEEGFPKKNKNLMFINYDLLNEAYHPALMDIIEENKISVVICKNKEKAIQLYRHILHYFPDQTETFFVEDLYHYSFFHLLKDISSVVMVNGFAEDCNHPYFHAYLASQKVAVKQING